MIKALGYHTFAKIIVVLAAYLLHFSLGKILTVEEYGIIGTIITFCNFYYMFLTNGVRQGISKMISSNEYRNHEALHKGMIVQVIFSFALAALNYFLAPFFADAFGDPAFTGYIRGLSILIPLTAIYFAYTGGLNGYKLFLLESIVVMVYPMLRLSSIPIALLMSWDKPHGVIIGFSLASLLSALLASYFLYRSKKYRQDTEETKKTVNYKRIIEISVEFIIFFAAITMVLNMDTFFLQYLCKDTELTGLYTGVHTFSLVPYYLLSAFYLVILPYITENYSKGDMKKIRQIISQNFNIIILFLLPIVLLISLTSSDLLACFYDSQYYIAGPSLSILCFGTFLLSVFAMVNVILNGINSKRISNVLSLIIVVLDIILLFLFIPKFDLVGAALATTISSGIGCILGIYYMIKKIGNPFSIHSLKKGIFLIIIFCILSKLVFVVYTPTNLILLMLVYAALAVLYLLCMIVFKVFNLKSLLKK